MEPTTINMTIENSTQDAVVVLNTTYTTAADNSTEGQGSSEIHYVNAYWSSFIEHPQAQQSTEFGMYLRLIGLPLILLAGFLGNGLTIALMTRPSMRGHSYSPYLIALAVSDSMALFVRLVFWINLLSLTLDRDVLIFFATKYACALVEYVCTANHVLCSWLVVCMTYERVIVIALPLKSARFVSNATSVKVVACFVVCSFLLTIYVPLFVQWVPEEGGCVIPFPREIFIHFGIATTFVSIAPLALICCGNIIIVAVLFRQSRLRAKLMGSGATVREKFSNVSTTETVSMDGDLSGTTEDKDENAVTNKSKTYSSNPTAANGNSKTTTSGGAGSDQHVRRVTFTLLVVSLSFLILVMPNAVTVLALGIRPDWTHLLPAIDPLALLWDANFAINFYLYVFAGANFRAEVVKMLKCQ